jgi:hypothetical protein
MRRFLAPFSEPVWSGHVPSWADFITTTPELKFSVHTGLAFAESSARLPRKKFTGLARGLSKLYLDDLWRDNLDENAGGTRTVKRRPVAG